MYALWGLGNGNLVKATNHTFEISSTFLQKLFNNKMILANNNCKNSFTTTCTCTNVFIALYL